MVPMEPGEDIKWTVEWCLEKRVGDDPTVDPYEVIKVPGNLLMYGGASLIIECLIGNGTATTAQTLTFLKESEATLGVGDSLSAVAATQTDLQAATNKVRKAMDATYPTHTDGTTSAAASVIWKSTFGTGDANYAWNEAALFNGSSGGRMLNRKLVSMGTKTSADTWTLSLTATIA